jgi:hypothetical protein
MNRFFPHQLNYRVILKIYLEGYEIVSGIPNIHDYFVEVSEWLLFNANSAIFQLYHGENKLIFNMMMMGFALY